VHVKHLLLVGQSQGNPHRSQSVTSIGRLNRPYQRRGGYGALRSCSCPPGCAMAGVVVSSPPQKTRLTRRP